VIEFTKSVISALNSFVPQRSFSIVAFATDAELVSKLTTAREAMDSLDALTFMGGRTNHAAAINSCRLSLESYTQNDRMNFLLLVTDGNPSEPASLPEAEAKAAAEVAKSGGIFIIPVMIKQDISPYLQGISSDGIVFNASDFDELLSLQATLLMQVECL
jgi:Mg-chelatase subunit ChlD